MWVSSILEMNTNVRGERGPFWWESQAPRMRGPSGREESSRLDDRDLELGKGRLRE